MATLRTPSKQVIVQKNTSEIDEIVIPCNVSTIRLGQAINFQWDVGASNQKRIKVREALIEWRALINALDGASVYVVNTLWSFIDKVEVLVNDVTIHETISADLRHQKLYLSRIADVEPNDNHFLSSYGMEMYDHGGEFNPYNNGSSCNSKFIRQSDPVATTQGYQITNHLERFFDGIFTNLPLQRIRKIEVRLNFTSQPHGNKFGFHAGPLDVGRVSQLVEFRNMQLRIRFERYADNISDPISSGMPLVLHSPRFEVKTYQNAFNNADRKFRINLKSEFSPSNLIQRVYFYAEDETWTADVTGPGATSWKLNHYGIDSIKWDDFLQSITILKNGEVMEQYNGTQNILGLLNKQLWHEHGHISYMYDHPSNVGGSPISVLRKTTELPYYSFLGINEAALSNDQARKTLIIGGKSNKEDNWELEFVAKAQNTNNFTVIKKTEVTAEVWADGSIKVSGR